MSDEIVIRAENVSKRYRISHLAGQGTLRDTMHHAARLAWRRLRWNTRLTREDFWALRDVNFEIKRGDVVGVIGRNGAGKSTLLKLLSRITEPTSGRISIQGRMASLLEVGTGFHPDLSGRDNIYLNGALLGMKRAEIRAKFDEIVTFAEVERFLDTPVKRYSSGMYVRLAFSVAAHLEPEILIIDEVLAVGDAAFQKKCLGKINQVSRDAGRTVIFVSHSMGVVANLCRQAIFMERGQVVRTGPVGEIVGAYIQSGNHASGEVSWEETDERAGNTRMRLRRARVVSEGRVCRDVPIDRDIWVEYEFSVFTPGLTLTSSIHLFDKHGSCVLSSGPGNSTPAAGVYRDRVRLPANFLNDGLYSVSILLITESTHIEVNVTEAITFTVHETGAGRGEFTGTIIGCIRPRLDWESSPLV
jgi:lipopolysaccharide transport system ATP-binding protein